MIVKNLIMSLRVKIMRLKCQNDYYKLKIMRSNVKIRIRSQN